MLYFFPFQNFLGFLMNIDSSTRIAFALEHIF